MADLPLFQQIKLPNPPRNEFDLSFSNHLTTDFGRITPILVKETLPADRIDELGSELFIRSTPLATPVMGRIKAYVHGFFVPNRIMWSHWERFISGWDGVTIADETDPVAPYFTLGGYNGGSGTFANKSLADYLGIPTGSFGAGNCLAFRANAYARIYDEWYRDQNIESSSYAELTDGIQAYNNLPSNARDIKYRAFRKDYFTSALPWPQRGDQMTFPLGVSAPIRANASEILDSDADLLFRKNLSPISTANNFVDFTGGSNLITETTKGYLSINGTIDSKIGKLEQTHYVPNPSTISQTGGLSFVNSPNGKVSNLYADLAAANVLTVNEFRRTMALQRWLETSARGGSRYNETLYAHFGVKIPDYRINRSQYLGGSSIQFGVEPIAQNSQTDDSGTPQGTLVGKATAYGYCGILDKPFEPMEHGILMLLLSIMPEATYYQGLDRHWTKFDKFDYAWPEFAHLGEQEVSNGELYLTGNGSNDATTFGYQSRFAEDKFSFNEIHGDLRDTTGGISGNNWVVSRTFGSAPTLSNTFIKVTPSQFSHIFAYTGTDYDHFIVEAYNHYKVNRCLPIFGTPE